MKNLLRYIKIILITCCFLVCSIAIAGCAGNSGPDAPANSGSTNKPVVAVSIVPQETFVKAVAGDLVDTVVLVPPGYSPANYAPSPQKLEQLSDAALYFAIGVPAENANILPRLPDINKDIKVIDLPAEVRKVYPDREFAPGERDPHIWLSPKRVQVMVTAIARELSKIDPQNKGKYEANAREYNRKLGQLDQKIKASLKDLPNKTFIVYHPAFGYFADDYGLKMVAIEKGGKEATAGDIQNIINLAKAENIKVIFYQASITSKQAGTIAEEIGGRTQEVDPLAPNYIENLEKTAEALARALE